MSEADAESGWFLEQIARDLSARHHLSDKPALPIPAWAGLDAAFDWLHDVRCSCVDAPAETGKAAEWLLDNDYQVHRALRQIRKDLPRSFYARLPAIEIAAEERVPRVFAMAHELLRATRLQISLANSVRFVRAYQHGVALTIAELWAFPTMLRIASVEILVTAMTPLVCASRPPPFPTSDWAADPESLDPTERVARSISNLGAIAAIPWEDFFERTSRVEEILREDPSGFYAQMDFESRDRYRRRVEDLSRYSSAGESDVAEEAVGQAASSPAGEAAAHVGYWLVGTGQSLLDERFGVAFPFRDRVRRWILRNPATAYSLALALTSVVALVVPAVYLAMVGANWLGWIAGLLLSSIPASILAITAVHLVVTRSLPPRALDKLDFSKGLARDCRTAIAVPVIVAGTDEVSRLAEQMETHWLANADPLLQVALLADFRDAPEQHMPDDAAIQAALESRVRALNDRHGENGKGPFHLLLRSRTYSRAQGCWLAWERKRGKLEQFNRFLIDREESAFALHIGDRTALEGVRFVVTVDADTMLPPGSVAKLAGALAHPLNRARFDRRSGRIISGYSIIQPRVEISPQSGTRTLFARLFTGETAIDIYSRAVSDFYQDLFGAGIFVGKGIYDLKAFHESVDGRVPEDRILSHDLFEGAHGRTALATDIVLYEGFPATYPEYARRMHRWIRGDWQLLPWLGGRVPAADGKRLPNRLSGIDRWKIIDNLRRSLIAPSLLLLALAGWSLLPGSPWFWTLLVLLAPAGQLFTDLVSGLARGRRRGAVRGFFDRLSDQTGRWLLAIVYLLFEAALALHAIGLTLWRMAVTRRHLLEWTTAAHTAAKMRGLDMRAGVWRQMWWVTAAAIGIAAFLLAVRPHAAPAAFPLLLLWSMAPEITFRIGRARKRDVEPLAEENRPFLRSLARKTWYFFETFAGPEDHWLPPDNYQGEPHEEIAHRTSPTNIGMLLLSTAAAWDLGYIGRTELAARSRNVLDGLNRLERYRGHIYNWYDTRSLRPLEPRYVSTVDSGNLALSLIAYAEALREAGSGSGIEPQRWQGLDDVLGLLDAALSVMAETEIRADVAELRKRLANLRMSPETWRTQLDAILQEDIPRFETDIAKVVAPPTTVPVETLRELNAWLDRLRQQIRTMLRDLDAQESAGDFEGMAAEATAFAYGMEFAPLYNPERGLFHIGHNVSSGKIDQHFYDLLASEARLASFFAIAKGDVPLDHWFHLGRPITRVGRSMALISWNGSMFEYLMPRLFLRSVPETLLYESERTAVRIQRDYGNQSKVPWGISESAYAARDPEHRYRYQAFGVPGIGLRRGLARDMVVAPYASALALAVAPTEAARNLAELLRLGAGGRFGLFEAADFTTERRSSQHGFTPVKAYMAHHQGMILCAIDNALDNDVLVRRLQRDSRLNLISLLLSERLPTELPAEIERLDELDRPVAIEGVTQPLRSWEPAASAPFPQVLLLGNGRLSSWISEGGGGGLRWRGSALTRFVSDATRDTDGLWIYLFDDETGDLWSATRQPTGAAPDEYRTVFHPHFAEFHRRDHGIELRMEAGVAAGDDIEIRRVVVTNESDRRRSLRLTSYAEIVLAPPLEDERHPAFSKLFVSGEHVPHLGGLLHSRRARSPHETPPVMLHFAIDPDGPIEGVRFDCDRRAFIGRGNDARNPVGAKADLANTSGCTLDPIAALQVRLDLGPYERREICFLSVAAGTRQSAIEIAERYLTPASVDWALKDAALETSHAVRQLRLGTNSLHRAQLLGSLLVHPSGVLRETSPGALANRLGQPSLWGMAISGDVPIVLLRAGQGSGEMLEELVSAHQHWRRVGLGADVVILQEGGSAYIEPLRDEVIETLRDIGALEMLGRKGGIHLLFSDQIGADQVHLLEAVAVITLSEADGNLAEHLDRAMMPREPLPLFVPSMPEHDDKSVSGLERPTDLLFDNGIGGFSADGREYIIHLEPGERTPAPWSNVLANDNFGCLVTETGGGFAWAVNSGENRITPWTNDSVSDRPTEIVYLRDEETGRVWSVTPAPAGGDAACQVRHGAGYSEWRKRFHGLEQELLIFVPPEGAAKIVRLRVRDLLGRHRRLTATYYAEWLLGSLCSMARPHVRCSYDAAAQVLFARNSWNPDFAERVAFLTASRKPHGFTTDRREFLGSEVDLAHPAGLGRWGLSGEATGGLDPCAAYQVHLDIAPGGSEEVVFVLGQGEDENEARALADQWSDPGRAEAALGQLLEHWDGILETIAVRTPDPAFDLMANRWLLYQSLSSRILARSGFYQASGAIGFRDQLQDVLAFLHSDPQRVRAHILLCAEHQFEEGDVLHWWHPPSDRGVRTRCSDDLLWLPYAVGTYVAATGDVSILHERLRFLDAPPLGAGEHDRYARFEHALPRAPLIAHCERALERALVEGVHGLPLIGSGDWNDGMDRIGKAGRGESVWLAWFASVTAEAVAELNVRIGREREAERWRRRSRELRQSAEEAGWDGEWYRRAYDDDGHAWGSRQSEECRIDSISQSWAAFAGGNPARVDKALSSALTELVDREHGLARLLWPPFDHTSHDPGYIKAYPPGIRENGGQYSHAAAWLGLALTRRGRAEEAMDVFKMLSPISRTAHRAGAEHYRGEPYVVAGDISAASSHEGCSGWTWYTGSAAWTWRLAMEGILGLNLVNDRLRVSPCIPADWKGFEAKIRRGGGTVNVRVENANGAGHGRVELTVNGASYSGSEIEFPKKGAEASVIARIIG